MSAGTDVIHPDDEDRLLQMAPDAMLVVDQSGRIVQANALAERLFGYPPSALADQSLDILIPARLRDLHQQHVAEYLRNPRPRPMGAGLLLWSLRQDGSEFAAQISLNPLPTPTGLHVLATVRDVSEHRRMQQALEQATADLERQVEVHNEELLQANAELRQQVAGRLQAEAALRETEALYRQLVENQPDLICRFLPDTTLTFVNAAYARFFERQPNELLGQRFIEFLCAQEQAEVREQLAAFTPAAPARQYEHKTIRADGIARWHLWHDFAFFDDHGQVTGFQSIGVDITERKQAEARLQTVNRALQLRSACNQALVKATHETALLNEICRLTVEVGGYRLAWVGLAEQDEHKTVRSVGQAGYEAGYLESIRITWADCERGQSPTGTAIRTGQPVVARNLLTDPHYAPWRAEAYKRGYASSAALPLRRAEQTFGALNIYAAEPGAFDAEETQLLAELADDLAYGLLALRARAEHQQMEVTLRDSEERYHQLFELGADALFLIDNETGRILAANAAAEELYGYGREELLRMKNTDLSAEAAATRAATLVGQKRVPVRFHRKRDGSVFPVDITARHFQWQKGEVHLAAIRDITERLHAQQEIEKQRLFLRMVIDADPHSIFVKNRYGQIILANQSLAASFGLTPEQMVGHTLPDFCVDPELARTVFEDDLAILDQMQDKIEREAKFVDQTGKAHWVYTIKAPIKNEAGEVEQLIGVSIDITERKRVETALHAQEQRFRALIENSADAIALFDPEGTVLYASPPTKAILGYEPAAVIGHLAFEFIHPDWQDSLRDRVAESLRNPKAQISACAQALHKNGSQRYLEGTLTNLLDDPAVGAIVVNYRDSTTRKRAEEVLAEKQAMLQALLDNSPAVIGVKTVDGRYAVTNRTYKQLFGLPETDLTGLTDYDIFPKDLAEVYQAGDRAVATRGESLYQEEVAPVAGSLRHFLVVKFPLRDSENRTFATGLIATDITERKQAEEALFEAKERAQVTLHSIGDAVITTDAHAVVDYLNPVAEALTGWSSAEAQGRPLSAVFQIVNEQTRQPAPDPVARCLQAGKIVGLANHSVLINRHGQEYHIDDSAAPIRGRDGQVLGAVLVFHDVTEHRQLTRQLEYDATHDALTGLINRPEFERRLGRALASAQQYGARHALCYLDLDQFKIVNDTAGHAAGDELLRQINTILAGMFRERDTLARIGGDEFGLLLDNCPLERAQLIAQTVVSNIRDHRFHWEGRTYQIGASIGLVPITAETPDTAQLLTQADVACYIAKEMGRNRVHLYQREDSETAQRHGEILGAAGLRDSLEQGRFRLYYQPIVSLAAPDPHPVRYEVLLRVAYKGSPEETSELVLPAAFIPAAERYGLMGAIDRWVIQAAFRDYAAGIGQTGAKIAINLSGNSLSDETLLDFIEAQFAEHAFPPERVCFEITETAAIQNLRRAIELMTVLKQRGSQFALDDFGSGLSSFHYLKTLPVDYLKIDGSFVKDMIGNASDCALVAAINQMSHTLGIQTIAEYAHSQAIIERLRKLGVDYAQGYFFGQPAPWGQQS